MMLNGNWRKQMFRDCEIIGLLNILTKKIDALEAEPKEDIFQKLSDIEDTCIEIKSEVQDMGRYMRSDSEIADLIIQALEQYGVKTFDIKEEKKTSLKKIAKKK